MSRMLEALRQLQSLEPAEQRHAAAGESAAAAAPPPSQACAPPSPRTPASESATSRRYSLATCSATPAAERQASPLLRSEFESTIHRNLSVSWRAGQYQQLLEEICAVDDLRHGGAVLLTSVEAATPAVEITAHLGTLLAQRQSGNVLLADVNFSANNLTNGFQAANRSGLSEALTGSLDWREAVLRLKAERLHLMPSGQGGPPHDAATQARLADFLDQWRRQFRFVLAHSGRVESPFTCMLSRLCSAVYLVVQLEATGAAAALEAVRRLCRADAQLRGCIVSCPASSVGE